jgi:acetyl-CoA carboxylase biotin carboxyl carrier protein
MGEREGGSMDLDRIKALVQLVEESGIDELELSNRGETIRICKGGAGNGLAPTVTTVAPALAASPQAALPQAAPQQEPAIAKREGLREVASPMVGTFYRAPSPDSEPFVRVGDQVETDDVLCIVEAMKLMNEIEAEFSGIIREILVENAQPVEFGQPLFLIEATG